MRIVSVLPAPLLAAALALPCASAAFANIDIAIDKSTAGALKPLKKTSQDIENDLENLHRKIDALMAEVKELRGDE